MKLYRCKTPTDRLCACGRVARALRQVGVDFETERVPLSSKSESRQEVMQLTGQPKVPVVVFDDGSAMHDSRRIVEHLRGAGSAPGGP